MLLHACWFPDAYTPRPTRAGRFGWDAIACRLTAPPPLSRRAWVCVAGCPRRAWHPGTCPTCDAPTVLDKRTCPAWSPWQLRPGWRRCEAAAIEGSALVVDYDGGISLDDARASWSDWAHAAHTSWSHADDADAHVRIVRPLARRVPREGYGRLFAWSVARDPRQDRTVGDPARLWFLPMVREGARPRGWQHDGPRLAMDWRDLPPTSDELARELARAGRAARDELGRFADSDLYRSNPSARAELAISLGGAVSGNIARGIACPKCGRPSVWWRIEPGELAPGAYCDHKRSCGWGGWLDTFARARGAA